MTSDLVDLHGAHITTAPTVPIRLLGHGFAHSRAPEPGWRDQLAAFSPPGDQVPYLWLDWLAGVPEAPVQRWGLWEVMPAALLDKLIWTQRVRGVPEEDILLASIVRDLNEAAPPNDPSRGQWVRDKKAPGGKQWSADSLANQQQWELWRDLKGFATLFWIVQGQHGGHKRTFSEIEEIRLRRLKRPWQAPIPGSLSYAPFDRRVLDQLARLDRITRWEGDFRKRVRSHQAAVEVVEAERVASRERAEAEADEYLELQIASALDELPDWRVSNIVSHLPVRDEPDRRILIRGGR